MKLESVNRFFSALESEECLLIVHCELYPKSVKQLSSL